MKVLVLNSGSSSQKSSLYQMDEILPNDPPTPLWEGKIEWRDRIAEAEVKNSRGVVQKNRTKVSSRAEAVEHLLGTLTNGDARAVKSLTEIDVVGHRVVHGGPKYEKPVSLTPEVRAEIAKASVFAPLHNRAELEGIEIIEGLLGRVPQVAVFDTGFHRKMPDAAAVYPGPYLWFEHDIRRYGFHGINHQYCATRAARLLGQDLNSLKLVTCHLGNGCSLAAIRDGHSIDTTMGFTPLEGLMMGTRSGSIDPSILLYLQREKGYTGEQLDQQLNKESGLLGISGISGDMRQLYAAIQQGNERARQAVDIFVHRLRGCMGAMLAVLGGVDVISFTGGIGENDANVRARACEAFGFLNLQLDEAENKQSPADQEISTAGSEVRVLIIHTEEDWEIAKECWKINTSD